MQTQLSTDDTTSLQSNNISKYIFDNKVYGNSCDSSFNCKIIPTTSHIDSESKLLGLGVTLNKLPPDTQRIEENTHNIYKGTDVYDDEFIFENTNQTTRVSKSCNELSQIERFNTSFHDVQKPFIDNNRNVPVDTRNLYKDKM